MPGGALSAPTQLLVWSVLQALLPVGWLPHALSPGALPGPVFQSGAAGAGTLRVSQEPTVDLVGVRVDARVTADLAHVQVEYTLVSAVERSVELALGAAVFPTESDGATPPSPWRDAAVAQDGAALKTFVEDEPVAREAMVCGVAPVPQWKAPARGQWLKARIRLQAGVPSRVRLSYTTVPQTDDWRDAQGRVERSVRTVCVRTRPLRGFQGRMQGRSSGRITVEAPGFTPEGGPRSWDDVGPLDALADVVVHLRPDVDRTP